MVAAFVLAAAVGVSAAEPLVPGVPATTSLATKAGRSFSVVLGRDECAEIRVVRCDSPVALLLHDPSGAPVRQWIRDPGAASGSVCPQAVRPDAAWVADTSGAWTLDVLPPEGSDPFEATLVWAVRRKASAADRVRWKAELADARVGTLLDAGKAKEAAKAADELLALRESEHAGDSLALAADVGWLGVRFYQSALCRGGAWEVSEKLVRKTLALREAALGGNDLCVADSLSLVSSVLYGEGRFREGETLEARSLAIRESHLPGSLPAWRRGLRDVGLLRLQQGKYAEAAVPLERALESIEADTPPDPHLLADAMHNVGELYRNQDRYDAAAEAFTRAEALERGASPPDWLLLSEIATSIAGVHLDRAEYGEAERWSKRTLEILAAHPDVASPDLVAMGKNNLGEIYRRQGRLRDAEPLLVDSLAAARDALCPENPALLFFRVNLAMLYAEDGRIDRAEPLYRESLEAQEKVLGPDHPNVSWNLHDYADTLADAGHLAEAKPLYERALAIRAAVYGEEHPVTETTRIHLARVQFYDGSRPADALLPEVSAARAALASSPAYPESGIDALTLEADLLERTGRRKEARAALASALSGIESLRPRRGGGDKARADFLRRHLDDYDRMIAWSIADGDLGTAFAVAERSRARALLDLLTAGTGDLERSLDPATRARLAAREAESAARLAELQGRFDYERRREDVTPEERRRNIADLEAGMEAAARALQLVADDAKNESPLWRDTVGRGRGVPSLEAVRRDLVAAGGALLEFHIGREGSWLFVVPAAGAASVIPLAIEPADARTLGIDPGPLDASRLEAALGDGPRAIGVPLLRRLAEAPGEGLDDPQETIAELAALRRVLVPDAVWSSLRREREAVIVPDGPLAAFPFEALVSRAAGSWAAATTWLDAGPPIRYAPSATILASVGSGGSRAGVAGGLLTVADPDYGGRFPAVPGTRLESAAIADAFRRAGKGGGIFSLEGAAATEAAVREALPSHRFVHLATHALSAPDRSDLLAGLALAAGPKTPPDPGDDGLLRLYEIDSLETSADLVVLSACDTGVGRRVAGEGVFSLARGFFAAGARRVVASLWPVPDASTATLMGALFKRVAKETAAQRDADYSTALRDAKRALRREPATAAPFAWAPFTLTGRR